MHPVVFYFLMNYPPPSPPSTHSLPFLSNLPLPSLPPNPQGISIYTFKVSLYLLRRIKVVWGNLSIRDKVIHGP